MWRLLESAERWVWDTMILILLALYWVGLLIMGFHAYESGTVTWWVLFAFGVFLVPLPILMAVLTFIGVVATVVLTLLELVLELL